MKIIVLLLVVSIGVKAQSITYTGTITASNFSGLWIGTPISPLYGGIGSIGLGSPLQQIRINAGGTAFEYFTPVSGSGITNGAANTELMMSNGTNAVPSGVFADATGNLNLGTSLSGTTRIINSTGSATDVGLSGQTKGAGAVTFSLGNGNAGFGLYSAQSSTLTSVQSPTSTTINVLELRGESSGTTAVGFGTNLVLASEAGSGMVHGSILSSVATNVGAGTESFDLVFRTMSGGATAAERIRISSLGAIGLSGANYGTSGQVLTSQGSGSAPIWSNPLPNFSTVNNNTTLSISGTSQIVRGNTTSASVTTTLPTAVGNSGYIIVLKRISDGTNTWIIDGNGSETIDGALTALLTVQYESITIFSNGTNWEII